MSPATRSAPLALLRLVRWPGAVTAAGNAATAFLLAHTPESPGGWAAAAGAIAGGALVYAGGVALNDVADAARDVTLHPERPIPSGAVTRRAGAVFGVALLVAGIAACTILAGPTAGTWSAAAAAFAVFYDFGGKTWVLPGALLMGLARGANALAGALAADAALVPAEGIELHAAHLHALALLAYTAVLTLVSTREGARPSAFTAGGCAAALVVVAAVPWPSFDARWREAPALAFLPLAASLINGAREAMAATGPGLGHVVRRAVFGFLLVDAAWLFGAGKYDYGFWLLLVYLALRMILARARS